MLVPAPWRAAFGAAAPYKIGSLQPLSGAAAPDFVYFLVSGETVIFSVMGGIGTLVGPIVGAGFFLLLREFLLRMFGDQFPYLIPVGFIFIVMIIFLPQGLLGFAKRWLNR
jgi:branched-chain amino acid transport system permease protein